MFTRKHLFYTTLLAGTVMSGALSLSVQGAPQVSTLVSNGQSYDGIYVTKSGRIIVSHPSSDRLYEIIDGTTQLLTDGGGQFSYVVDINEDEAGNLLLTEYDRNRLLSMDNDGNLTTIASVPGGNDIVVDSNAAMYVADSKTNKIHQVLLDGIVNEVLSLSNPVGLAIDEQNNLYASVSTGQIYRIDNNARTATQIARVPSQIWHLEIMDSNTLLVAGYTSHQIYAVDTNSGSICVVAGSDNAGHANGAGTEASFTNPLDLAFDGGKTLYVTSSGSVRQLEFPEDSEICPTESSDNGTTDGGDSNGSNGDNTDENSDGSNNNDNTNNDNPATGNLSPVVPDESGGSFGFMLGLLSLFALRRLKK